MHIASEVLAPTQLIDKTRQRDGVGLKPVFRVLPAGRHLALRRKIDDIPGSNAVEQPHQASAIAVQVHPMELEPATRTTPVGSVKTALLGRAAYADHRVSRILKQEVDKVRPGERIAPQDCDGASISHSIHETRTGRYSSNPERRAARRR